jgi:CRISPR-associated protein Csb2
MGPTCKRGRRGWPPEPYRILRALIATWHRTADPARYDEDALERLIEALAGELPLFGLPDAVHAHTRHYMPQGKLAKAREETKLVFDGFLRISPTDQLISAWPATTLPAVSFGLATHLAERMNYFGRAESLVCAHTERNLDWEGCINTRPDGSTGASTAVEVLAALSPQAYAAERPSLLALNSDKPKSKKRLAFEATVPVSLFEAIQVETSALQAAGWSQPPGNRLVPYHRPEIGPRPPARRPPQAPSTAKLPSVARLVLAGRPLPRIEDAVKIAEVFRAAVIARIRGKIPLAISGRGSNGRPSRDPQHGHAFFLPEDHDHDGLIDHLVLCPEWPASPCSGGAGRRTPVVDRRPSSSDRPRRWGRGRAKRMAPGTGGIRRTRRLRWLCTAACITELDQRHAVFAALAHQNRRHRGRNPRNGPKGVSSTRPAATGRRI